MTERIFSEIELEAVKHRLQTSLLFHRNDQEAMELNMKRLFIDLPLEFKVFVPQQVETLLRTIETELYLFALPTKETPTFIPGVETWSILPQTITKRGSATEYPYGVALFMDRLDKHMKATLKDLEQHMTKIF